MIHLHAGYRATYTPDGVQFEWYSDIEDALVATGLTYSSVYRDGCWYDSDTGDCDCVTG